MEILDEGIGRQRTPQEESEFQLLRMDAQNALKNIRNGMVALFVIAGIQLMIGVVVLYTGGNSMFGDTETSFAMAVGLIIFSLVYGTLGFLCRKYPVACFSIALVFYLFTNLSDLFTDPSSIVKGILLKGILVWVWIKALQGGLAMKKLVQQISYLGATEADLRE